MILHIRFICFCCCCCCCLLSLFKILLSRLELLTIKFYFSAWFNVVSRHLIVMFLPLTWGLKINWWKYQTLWNLHHILGLKVNGSQHIALFLVSGFIKPFLNWLCQYLSFLNIFFQYILPGGREWGYPTLLVLWFTDFKIYLRLRLDLNLEPKRFKIHHCTKMKFFIRDIFSKCYQIRSFLWIWSHLLKKSLMENFILCSARSDFDLTTFFSRNLKSKA